MKPILFILISIMSFYMTSNAQISLEPSLQTLDLSKGAIGSGKLLLINSDDFSYRCKVYFSPMIVSEDGIPQESDSLPAFSCKDWLSVDETEFELPSKSKKELKIDVKAPRDAAGTYSVMYRADFIPMKEKSADEKASGFDIAKSWAGVMLVNIKSFENKIQLEPQAIDVYSGLENATVDVTNLENASWKVEMSIKNTGNLMAQSTGQTRIFSEAGQVITSAPLESGRGLILPGMTRRFTARGNQTLADGMYLLQCDLYTKGSTIIKSNTPFSILNGKTTYGEQSENQTALVRAAAPGFFLSNHYIENTISPESKRFISIMLRNLTEDTLSVVPKLIDWSVDNKSQLLLGTESASKHQSFRSWIQDQISPFLLMPKANHKFELQVNVPENLNGEYYGAVTFNRGNTTKELSAGLAAGRTCLIALTDVRSSLDSAKLENLKYKKFSATEDQFNFQIMNSGNQRLTYDGIFTIAIEQGPNDFKLVCDPIYFGGDNTIVMPSSYRDDKVNLASLKPGNYDIIIDFTSKKTEKKWTYHERKKIK